MIKPASLSDIERYILDQKMISLGNRGADVFEAKFKINGWSNLMQKEFGVGYKTMVINSLGEQYGDMESDGQIDNYFIGKDITMARIYINKMATLDSELLKRIEKHPEADYTEELSTSLMYFIVVRWIIENIYEASSEEDKAYIDAWRNDPNLFRSLEKFYDTHPEENEGEWSMVGVNGEISKINKIVTYNLYSPITSSQTEVKGSIGFPGIISGPARLVLSKEDRDAVQEGEIIIAPMTTVDFLPVMKKAIAFVTDEGGVTCHAAIVAREMKKPCVIGTKTATKIFKTGDIIEVDATKGIVKVINLNK